MSDYIKKVSDSVASRYSGYPEYVQAVQSWLETVAPAVSKNEKIEKFDLLTRMVEADRMISFLVPWEDDEGNIHTSHGYRCQFNNALGPYKGGTRFQPCVTAGTVRFLAFEQTYKNAMTGLAIGGAAGGADFDPAGRSDREIMRFCHSYMDQLFRYIGSDTDIPSGDIGAGDREIGLMYGEYKKLSGKANPAVMTGKGTTYGGTKVRKEAAGFGAVYFLKRMMEEKGESIEGTKIAVSGFGNVAWGVCKAAANAGASVVTLSGPDGSIYDPEGITSQEKLDFIEEMRASGMDQIKPYADKFNVEYREGKTPWSIKVDAAIPCAVENELDEEDAVCIIANGVKYYVEAANMPATKLAMKLLRLNPGISVAGSKAAGVGGVAVSALEMAQNSVRENWSDEEMQGKLEEVMDTVFSNSLAAAKEYGTDITAGNEIAGFIRVSESMIMQGL